jgi:ubiquinone/menaquinone biosynthesis C-methylase UbiE
MQMSPTIPNTTPRLCTAEIEALDPYVFMAVLGKRVIHPGGRRSTEALLGQANLKAGDRVLDVGCGVGTTAIEMVQRFKVRVTAVDISPIMLASADANVRKADLSEPIEVCYGDILALDYADNSFDCVVAEAVTMFVDRPSAARELVRVCRPGGRVLTTEFLWRKPPTPEARQIFLGEICPGLNFDTLDDWVAIYRQAGLDDIEVTTGSFEMMTPAGFLADEGIKNSIQLMMRTLSRWSYLRKMAWLMPRMQRAVPFLGYVTVSGVKPI